MKKMIQSYILCDENMSLKLSNSHSYLKWICIGCTAELHVFQSVSPQVKEGFHMFTFQFPTRKEKNVPPKSEEEVRSQRWSNPWSSDLLKKILGLLHFDSSSGDLDHKNTLKVPHFKLKFFRSTILKNLFGKLPQVDQSTEWKAD